MLIFSQMLATHVEIGKKWQDKDRKRGADSPLHVAEVEVYGGEFL